MNMPPCTSTNHKRRRDHVKSQSSCAFACPAQVRRIAPALHTSKTDKSPPHIDTQTAHVPALALWHVYCTRASTSTSTMTSTNGSLCLSLVVRDRQSKFSQLDNARATTQGPRNASPSLLLSTWYTISLLRRWRGTAHRISCFAIPRIGFLVSAVPHIHRSEQFKYASSPH